MGLPDDALSDLRFSDLLILLAVKRQGSVTAAARELNIATSQVSKAISRLESQFQTQLLARGPRGVTLSEAGARVLPSIEDVVAKLRFVQRNESLPGYAEMTIAGPSFLASLLVPYVTAALENVRVRALELAPPNIRALFTENAFDLALAIGPQSPPEPWVESRVGEVRQGLLASPEVVASLGPQPVSEEDVLKVPFVTPIASIGGRFVQGEDNCPVGRERRKTGHEVQTIGCAIEIAAHSGQLVFGPLIAAKRAIERGALVEIRVEGWDIRDTLYVVANGDRVLSKQNDAVIVALKRALDELA